MTHISTPHAYVLVIPGWSPALANDLVGKHWGVVARLKKRDAEQLARARLVYGVPLPTGRRKVSLTIWGRYSTFPDPDAPLKSFQDALTVARLIRDDAERYLLLDWPPQFRRGPKQTMVVIEEIPWTGPRADGPTTTAK